MYMYAMVIDLAPVSTILLLYFGTITMAWYFLFYILLAFFKVIQIFVCIDYFLHSLFIVSCASHNVNTICKQTPKGSQFMSTHYNYITLNTRM